VPAVHALQTTERAIPLNEPAAQGEHVTAQREKNTLVHPRVKVMRAALLELGKELYDPAQAEQTKDGLPSSPFSYYKQPNSKKNT
jgi:hypothetical protein